jgi:hexosaminidase
MVVTKQTHSVVSGVILLLAGCASLGAPSSPPDLGAVIPAPRQAAQSPGAFELTNGTAIVVEGGAEAEQVARQFVDRLATVPGIGAKLQLNNPAPAEHAVRLRLRAGSGNAPESYRLSVTPGSIEVEAGDVAGLRHGTVTLWQLAAGSDVPGRAAIPAGRIDDSPRFRWRGLMLDSARHYQSPEFIEQYLDWMALHKFNVLHWHLTDDQAWRLEIRRYPRLTDVGAWRVPAGRAAQRDLDPITGKPRLYGGFYSQDTVRRIVKYAAERSITVVPEIEMPGHAAAAVVAYPELGAGVAPRAVPADWGIYSNLFNVEEATFAFLENVLREVLELFPSVYIHVGGDEAVKDQWRSSARVQARMRELGVTDETALQGYFVQRIGKFLGANGRRLIGWDEILEGGLAPEATVMSWRGVDGARAAAQAGHDAVLAAWPTLYFDNRQGTASSEPPGRGRVVGLADVYAFDTQVAGLAPEQLEHVIGVQGNIWTEHIRTEDRTEWMTWPRAAAVAELGWSPLERRDYTDFRSRVQAALKWYPKVGLQSATSEFDPPEAISDYARHSQQLELCSDKLVLNLEDDAPVRGPRARFFVDIMQPCWLWRGVDLARGATLIADVGQFPFNFRIGSDREKIQLRAPATPAGELEVRIDGCDGARVASLPLAPALDADGITRLPASKIPATPGTHDLCFTFTGTAIDPMWAIDRLELQSSSLADGATDAR